MNTGFAITRKTGIHTSVYRKRTPFLISFTITGVDRREFVLVLSELLQISNVYMSAVTSSSVFEVIVLPRVTQHNFELIVFSNICTYPPILCGLRHAFC